MYMYIHTVYTYTMYVYTVCIIQYSIIHILYNMQGSREALFCLPLTYLLSTLCQAKPSPVSIFKIQKPCLPQKNKNEGVVWAIPYSVRVIGLVTLKRAQH